MKKVTKEQFWAYVNPRDICVKAKENECRWTTRGGDLVGLTKPGYKEPDQEKTYELSEAAYEAVSSL